MEFFFDEYEPFGLGPGGMLVAGFILLCVFCVGAVGAINKIQVGPEIAKIEQLRSDIARGGTGASEDVIGQATAWNQTIAEQKRYNQIPLICLTVPNEWDAVRPIRIP